MRVRGVAAGVVALALAAACTGRSDAEPGTAPQSGSVVQVPAAPGALDWTDCGGGFQCAKLQVPLDYADADGEQLTLALIRQPAKGKKIGSLLTNPGGPGGSGVDFLRSSAASFGEQLQQRFDLVGFDPRGVGQSNPVECLTDGQLDEFLATDVSPDDAGEIDELAEESRGFAEGCQSRSAKLLPHVGTRNAARDMDRIRQALGDEKLTYYGASYGTYLGAWYAELFPQNVRALVLDGAVDPKASFAEINLQQAKGFETALRAFTADCVKRDKCPLGNNVDAGLKKIKKLLDSTDRRPLTNGTDSREVTESLATLGLATPLYQKEAWPLLRSALTQAFAGDGSTLIRFADLLVEREENGTYSSQTESNMAVNCVDKPTGGLDEIRRQAARAAKEAPRFGEFIVWGALPCTYWPAKATEPTRALNAKGSAPILVVGTTRDPATPYQWSKNLASQLDKGVLLTYDGDGHTAYLTGSKCISSAVDSYLVKATPPASGTTCRP
ncbi:alpha/beta hydrolase [Actinocorallia populi]|uniref:alpha/beta hydrolase n=1 Tax=Actinocorallia populi TaxID=2079200 RepID=UPI000D08817A|nr:alpha/beta hydrolase [Actinocorallia populi]